MTLAHWPSVVRHRHRKLLLLIPPLYALGSIGLVHYEPRYVRYVQLSYVLAAVVLAQALWRRVERSTPLAPAAAGVVLALVALYAVRELHALRVAAVAAVAIP